MPPYRMSTRLANIYRYPDGLTFAWTDGTDYHREGAPAFISYRNGRPRELRWCVRGKEHRIDGPATQLWDEKGNPISEFWCLNGLLHRYDGPAHVWADYGTCVVFLRYWSYGVLHAAKEDCGNPYCFRDLSEDGIDEFARITHHYMHSILPEGLVMTAKHPFDNPLMGYVSMKSDGTYHPRLATLHHVPEDKDSVLYDQAEGPECKTLLHAITELREVCDQAGVPPQNVMFKPVAEENDPDLAMPLWESWMRNREKNG